MKKVYCVMQGELCQGGHLHGVFSTMGKAMEFAKNNFPEYDFFTDFAPWKFEHEFRCDSDWLRVFSMEVQ